MAKRQTKDPAITAELRNFLRAQPFSPFDIKTTDGATYHVFHPDYCMIAPNRWIAHLYEDEKSGANIVYLRHVVSIELSKPKKGLLGAPGKR